MLPKPFHYLLLSAIFLSHVAGAQKIYSVRMVDKETGLAVRDVMVRGNQKASDKDGNLEVTGAPGDTLVIFSPDYPIEKVVLGNESSLTVTLSKSSNDTSVYSVVDETAEFPGGMPKYYEYVMQHMVYPESAARDGIEGKVFVEFVIGRDGNIEKESVRVVAERDPRLNAEAMRVARESPAWKPGKKNGQTVRQLMVLPYTFKLDNKKKKR